MDLTIASGLAARAGSRQPKPADSGHRAAKERPDAGKPAREKGVAGALAATAARRHEKFRRRKITVYSLFNGQAIRQADPGLPGFPAAGGLKEPAFGSTDRAAPKAVLDASAIDSKAREQGASAGIAFDCREKTNPAAREVTACYVHKVDKAWKTHTYVTKKLADSNPGWGGGLAIGYAY